MPKEYGEPPCDAGGGIEWIYRFKGCMGELMQKKLSPSYRSFWGAIGAVDFMAALDINKQFVFQQDYNGGGNNHQSSEDGARMDWKPREDH